MTDREELVMTPPRSVLHTSQGRGVFVGYRVSSVAYGVQLGD